MKNQAASGKVIGFLTVRKPDGQVRKIALIGGPKAKPSSPGSQEKRGNNGTDTQN